MNEETRSETRPAESSPIVGTTKHEATAEVRRMPLTRAQQELVESALDAVDAIAEEFDHKWRAKLTEEELISEGCYGLVKASQTYDPSRGEFRAYAACYARGAMLKRIGRETKLAKRLVYGTYIDAWEFLAGQGGALEGHPLRTSEEECQRQLEAFSDALLVSMFSGLVARLEREGGEDGRIARATYARAVAALRDARSEVNDREQTLLRIHYDEGESLHVVAEALEMSYSAVKRLHMVVLGRLAVKLRRLGIIEAASEEP
jgi:RNA polymerase sigma factor (sigma-70 family)